MNSQTILIVDDTQQIRRLIEKVVSHICCDYQIVGLDNVCQVLEYLLTETPRLIISDIQMPEQDGYDLVEAVYAQFEPTTLPIILLSSWASHGDDAQIQYVLEDRGLPVVPIASKPIDVMDLSSKIKTVLSKSFVA